jgi:cytochrome d ubiquinol oxidase subunit II
MATLWFSIVALMLAAYVILDGFDIGAGAIYLFAAKTDDERRKILRSIGPVWDGNEVWLLAAGGALYFAFPQLYASSFSGFYLPLIMVLWMLMGRAVGLEFRSHLEGGVWKSLCDSLFAASSILLAIFYGAALGNVVRGVPLAPDHYFFLPLWTNWRVGAYPGILDWYTVLSGVVALVALSIHGAHWVALKTDGLLQQRARKTGVVLSPVLLVLTLVSLVATISIRPQVLNNFRLAPIGYIIPLAVFAGIILMYVYGRNGKEKAAFLASSAYLAMMLVGVAFALYPIILPASTGDQYNLTIRNSVTSAYAMKVALVWWTFGIAIAIGYFVFLYRMFKGKVSLSSTGEHGY